MWLPITIIAYLLNSIAIVIDKSLLKKSIPEPIVYTFFVTMLGLLALVLIPFGFYYPGLAQVGVSFAAGICFTFALFLMFTALKKGEASRVAPFIGGLNPLLIFILAWFFLGENLTQMQLGAFFLILAGGFILAFDWRPRGGKISRALIYAAPSALLFAVAYVITKYVYNHQSFISGFIWIRLGTIIGLLILFFVGHYREAIKKSFHAKGEKIKVIFLFGQAMGAASFILVNYAFSLGSVALVNALQGLQYVFLFLAVVLLARKYPHLLEEKLTPQIVAQKIISIILVFAGLFLLTIASK